VSDDAHAAKLLGNPRSFNDSRFVAQLEAMCAHDRETEAAERLAARLGIEEEARSRQNSLSFYENVSEVGSLSLRGEDTVPWYPPLEHLGAAKFGDPRAQYDVAFAYQHGQGVVQDYSEALRWYRKAAEQGEPSAQLKLGLMYEYGQGVEKDYTVAESWIRRSASRGNAAAQYSMGHLLEHGLGVPKNSGEAVEYYRKAALQNHAPAQFNLGCMFHNDHSITHDQEAVHWFKKAAIQGHVLAMVNFGIALHTGQGADQDFYLAAHWFTQAAMAGNAVAQRKLGYFFEHGQGCLLDDKVALRWYSQAADQGDELAVRRVQVVRERIRTAADVKLRKQDEEEDEEEDGAPEVKAAAATKVSTKATVKFGLMALNSRGGRRGVTSDVVATPRAAGVFSPLKSLELLLPKIV
jgi:TPR repeat protein